METQIQYPGAIQRVSVDPEHRCVYVQYTNEPISKTLEFSEDVNIDLDAQGHVVGIEIIGGQDV